MRRSVVRFLGLGSLVVVLGCDLVGLEPGVQKDPAPVPSAPPIAPAPPPAEGPRPSPPPALPLPVPTPAVREPVLGLSAGAALAGLAINQLRVTPANQQATTDHFRTGTAPKARQLRHELTFYAVFEAPFARRIEVRALDQDSLEIGRSEVQPSISQAADSSRYVTVEFDTRLPLDRVRTYVVYVDPAPEVPAAEEPVKAVSPKSQPRAPAPSPEPEPLHAPRPGLVPKDP